MNSYYSYKVSFTMKYANFLKSSNDNIWRAGIIMTHRGNWLINRHSHIEWNVYLISSINYLIRMTRKRTQNMTKWHKVNTSFLPCILYCILPNFSYISLVMNTYLYLPETVTTCNDNDNFYYFTDYDYEIAYQIDKHIAFRWETCLLLS